MTYEDWLPIAKVVEENDLIVISDEIYAELTYGQKHVSFAAIPGMKDRTILVSGFSKAFAMTGWRMGYACGHPELISAMTENSSIYRDVCTGHGSGCCSRSVDEWFGRERSDDRVL